VAAVRSDALLATWADPDDVVHVRIYRRRDRQYR
jgi:hypothetical protein